MSQIVNHARNQAKQLRSYSDELNTAKRQLDHVWDKLVQNWSGPEMTYVQQTFSQITIDIEKARTILNRADDTLVQVARQIEAEREAAKEKENKK